jgi:hypothetical protein
LQHQQIIENRLNQSDLSNFSSLIDSPVSTKYSKPKVILWKEPIDDDDDENLPNNKTAIESTSSTPTSKTFNPKKKWLREAWQEDLATPLDFNKSHPLYRKKDDENTFNLWQHDSATSANASDAESNASFNITRPSVIIMASTKENAMTNMNQ